MSYLRFVKTGESESGLTERWGVFSESSGDRLGTIRWFGRWRQYAFYPEPETLYNPDTALTLPKAAKKIGEKIGID